MQIEWDNKIGPATIVGLISIVSTIFGVGVLYASLKDDVKAASNNAAEAKVAVIETQKESSSRDIKISTQGERLSKIETSVSFIVPALQRIETAITPPRKSELFKDTPTFTR